MLDSTARIEIRRHACAAGYSPHSVEHGIKWAEALGATSAREGYILTLSRIVYTPERLATGARVAIADGQGPQS